MNRQSLIRLVAIAALSIGSAVPCEAVVNYTFSGAMVNPFGTHPIGTPFSGSITYDETQTDLSPGGPPDVGNYVYQNFSLTVGAETVNDNGPGQIYVYDNLVTPYPTDLMIVNTSTVSGSFGGLTLNPFGMMLALQDITGAAFSSIGLPGPGLTLDDFTQGNATFIQLTSTGPNFINARGELGNLVVPEPSAIWLAAAAAAATCTTRRAVTRPRARQS